MVPRELIGGLVSELSVGRAVGMWVLVEGRGLPLPSHTYICSLLFFTPNLSCYSGA